MKAESQKSEQRYGIKRQALTILLLFVAVNSLLAADSPGASIFKSKCVLCHGEDASGNTALGKQLQAANLRSKEVQKLSVAEMKKTVHDGKSNMPAFADQLTDEQIDQVVHYVRTLGVAKK